MELNQARIEDAIVREVADKIIGEDELHSRVKKAIDDRINVLFEKAVDTQVRAAVEAAVTDGFERAYCRVDAFGKREGAPTTIRAELEKLIGGYWNTMVNSQGEPTSGYSAKMTRAEWQMTKMVAADFQGEMKQHIINLGGSLKDKLRLELHQTVNKLLSEVFHVRSADDETSDRRDRSLISAPQKGAA